MSQGDVRLCLAASGGGHLRQLLDLEPFWSQHDHFFVTEDLPLGHGLARNHVTCFVPHVALGQAKLGAPFRMLWGAIRSLFISAGIVLRQRPTIVVTTGAGSMFFVVLFARLLGARIIVIDSFARFHRPSIFARIAGRLAHLRIAQSEQVAEHWTDAEVFDPFRQIEPPANPKKPLLFATVGATLPFDRLIELVADARAHGLIPERIIAQVGVGGTIPSVLDEVCETVPFDQVKQILRDADIVVCHGGTGSLITALREGCRVIAVPRRFSLGEHYDEHQTEITQAFAERGLLIVANTPDEMADALEEIRHRDRVAATTAPGGLINRLDQQVSDWNAAAAPVGSSSGA